MEIPGVELSPMDKLRVFPACGAEVYEEAPQCPVCGEYMIHETRVLVGKPVWYVLLAILGIVSVIVVLSGLLVV